jgi:hypothetical protein
MIGFTNQNGQRFRIRLEQGALRTDPNGHYIPGSRGHIYVQGDDSFGVDPTGGVAAVVVIAPSEGRAISIAAEAGCKSANWYAILVGHDNGVMFPETVLWVQPRGIKVPERRPA